MTPQEKLAREIALYTALVDARRERGADTIDHEAHLQLLHMQRAAMIGRTARMDDLDDVTALLGAQPPLPDAEQALTDELEHHARPAWWVPRTTSEYRVTPLSADELHVMGAAIARRWRRRRVRSWFRVLLDAWRAPMPEEPRRTCGRAGMDHFLP